MLQSRRTMAERKTKQDPSMCCLQQTRFRLKDTHRLKLKEWIMIFHENGNKNKKAV